VIYSEERAMRLFLLPLAVCAIFSCTPARAQKAPDAGYVFPAGGKAGTTVEVKLGGYDWTPDMEFFVHENKAKLDVAGPPGPILIPPPPYWFGTKGRIVAQPLPREVPARFVLPAGLPPGPVYWQAANANGGTSVGCFFVAELGLGGLEIVENEERDTPQLLAALPVTVSGRLSKNEEVDQYRFTAPRTGPITCELLARRIGSKFHGVLQVRDSRGSVIADAVDSTGQDVSLTFAAQAAAEYTVSVADIDYAGDRSFVYRLSISAAPRVVGTLPAVGKAGETRDVEFVGYGLTGGAKLESVTRKITFPKDGAFFDYRLETPFGIAPPHRLPLNDWTETVVTHARTGSAVRTHAAKLQLPAAITGVLDEADVEDRYLCEWKKGETWSLSLEARRIGSPLDVALRVLGPDGKQVAQNDDLPETTDAGLDFTVPADGVYQIAVSDMAGKTGSKLALYRLVVRPPVSDFSLHLPAQRFGVPLGGKIDVNVKAVRRGDFTGPISLKVLGLPAGITVPADLVIPAGAATFVLPISAGKDEAPAAGLITIVGTSTPMHVLPPKVAGPPRPGLAATRTALAPLTLNQAPRSPEENHGPLVLLASTMKPRFKGQPVDQDTGRKVHRGSTFPAEVIIERLDGFNGEIVLQMSSRQSYQVHGITGGDVKVPPGVSKTIYPCYMPEWLETTRTSRMGMIAVALVPDAKGKIRHVVNDITGFVTMTMEGALMKVSAEEPETPMPAGQAFEVRVKISRVTKLGQPVRLELRVPDKLSGRLKAEAVTIPVGVEKAVFRITPTVDLRGPCTFSIRGTAMQDGIYPVISEAQVTLEIVGGGGR
jgi:hypothetical protein